MPEVDVTSSVVQTMSYIAQCDVINTQVCVVIHSGYDVINIVDGMSHI